MILDTSFLIDVMRGKPSSKELLQRLIEKGTPITITAPSVFELFSGITQSSKPILEKEKVQTILKHQAQWPLEEESAELGGTIYGKLAQQGQTIEAIDAMIAAIALTHHEPVLTANVKHFSRIPGLNVETY